MKFPVAKGYVSVGGVVVGRTLSCHGAALSCGRHHDRVEVQQSRGMHGRGKVEPYTVH